MLLPVLLQTTENYFYGVPNEIIVGSAAFGGMFAAAVTIRFVYSEGSKPSWWDDIETSIAVYGMQAFQWLTVACFVVTLFLAGRVEEEMTKGYSSYQSLNKGYWNLIRIIVSAFVPIQAFLFESHFFFRAYCCLAIPGLFLCDIFSQVELASYVQCIEWGACELDYAARDVAVRWIVRDLVSVFFHGWATLLAWFAWGSFGFFSNNIYMPRLEHRLMSEDLKQHRQKSNAPKRRLGDSDFVI